MFRGERLDFTRPALQSAADAALDVLAGTVRAVRDEPTQATLTFEEDGLRAVVTIDRNE